MATKGMNGVGHKLNVHQCMQLNDHGSCLLLDMTSN